MRAQPNNFIIALTGFAGFFLVVMVLKENPFSKLMMQEVRDRQTDTLYLNAADGTNALFMEQRNNLSKLLNLKQQKIGQMECERITNSKKATSKTGGWCKDSGNHATDLKLAATLSEFFEGKYVGSFGDGPGRYKQLLLDSGKVKGYDAYDGAPYCETTSEGRVKFLDLTLPQYGLPLYDWLISLEVAEHIPKKFESIYIDNLVRHAREGVVLSWAIPGQGGYSHVNNRPLVYIKDLMASLGFFHDSKNTQKLQDGARFKWLRRNINVYRRNQLQSKQAMIPYA